MRLSNSLAYFAILACLITTAHSATAQTIVNISAQQPLDAGSFDTSSLIQRLEAAEHRIHELEVKPLPEVGSTRTTPISYSHNYHADDRLSELEKKWMEHEKVLGDLQSDSDGFVVRGHSGSTMKISGRVHLDYWGFPEDSPGVNAFETGATTTNPQDRINFRRMRFGVSGDVLENMLYKIEIEFAGGVATQYRDAYFGFKHLPFLQKVLIGNQKRPYGLDHLNSSRYNVFIERPFIIEAFNQDSRRLGITSYGVSESENFNWRFGVYNSVLVQAMSGHIGDQYELEVAGRFANTIWYDENSGGRGYAHWAVSGTAAHPDGAGAGSAATQFRTRPEARSSSRWLDTGTIAGANNYQLLGLESVLNLGRFQTVGEYQHVWYQRDAGAGPDLDFGGGYVYLSYFLTGEHHPWDRKSGTIGRVKPFENFFCVGTCDGDVARGLGAWEVAVRYSYADLSDENVLGGLGESVTVGLNWYWNPYARMQFNYIHGNIRNHAAIAGQTSGNYGIIGVRGMIDF